MAKSGDGNDGNSGQGATCSGGSGGSGGIVVSVFKLSQNETVSISISGNVTISCKEESATATAGGKGSAGQLNYSGTYPRPNAGSGGSAGSASGGNLANIQGNRGNDGDEVDRSESGYASDSPSVSTSYNGYSTTSGKGTVTTQAGTGTAAYVVVLRGNTNISPDQLNAQDITTLMLNVSRLFQEQTGILMQHQ